MQAPVDAAVTVAKREVAEVAQAVADGTPTDVPPTSRYRGADHVNAVTTLKSDVDNLWVTPTTGKRDSADNVWVTPTPSRDAKDTVNVEEKPQPIGGEQVG